jgi:hypothetical protein
VPEVRPPRRKGIRSTRGHRLHVKRATRSDRIELNLDALHRHFWRRRDHRNRLPINVGDLAVSLGVCYDLANEAVISMRNEGRMRPVAWMRPRVRVYQIANPTTWAARDTRTHARPATKPQWG